MYISIELTFQIIKRRTNNSRATHSFGKQLKGDFFLNGVDYQHLLLARKRKFVTHAWKLLGSFKSFVSWS